MNDLRNTESNFRTIGAFVCVAISSRFKTERYLATKNPDQASLIGVSVIRETRSGDHWGRINR
jgi:hypothetical protein